MKVVNNTQLPTMVEPIKAQINTNGLVCALSFFFTRRESDTTVFFAFSIDETFTNSNCSSILLFVTHHDLTLL